MPGIVILIALATVLAGFAAPASAGSTPQSIVWLPIAGRPTVGGIDINLNARASGGGLVEYATTTAGTCSIVDGRKLRFLAAGTCTITANQAGDATFAAATQVSQTITILPPAVKTLRVEDPVRWGTSGVIGSRTPLKIQLWGGSYPEVEEVPKSASKPGGSGDPNCIVRDGPDRPRRHRYELEIVRSGACELRVSWGGHEYADDNYPQVFVTPGGPVTLTTTF